jgi:hypothetical protein
MIKDEVFVARIYQSVINVREILNYLSLITFSKTSPVILTKREA